jgi:hypothetical protein
MSMKRVAPALLAGAVVVPAAQAGRTQQVAGNSHLQQLAAMANAHQARASRLAPWAAGYSSHLEDLTAMAHGAWRLPIAGSVVRAPAPRVSGRFDWADAAIGALSGFAAALALAGDEQRVMSKRRVVMRRPPDS